MPGWLLYVLDLLMEFVLLVVTGRGVQIVVVASGHEMLLATGKIVVKV